MDDQIGKKHVFSFNPNDNNGEQLILVTKFTDNGDGYPDGIYVTQELRFFSHCNAATFYLTGVTLNPENLRELANQLESEEIKAALAYSGEESLTPQNK